MKKTLIILVFSCILASSLKTLISFSTVSTLQEETSLQILDARFEIELLFQFPTEDHIDLDWATQVVGGKNNDVLIHNLQRIKWYSKEFW